MPDKLLTCQNCGNPFVYSEYEQNKDLKENRPQPIYDPICNAIKQAETKHPPKPKA